MALLDSSSSIISCCLTRKGRELLSKNSGEFRISKFSLSDDEVNYQLYDSATDNDTDILNLPILEPSSNELAALRNRLVTMPKGTIQVAYLVSNPASITLSNRNSASQTLGNSSTITVKTVNGNDSSYLITVRDPSKARSTLSVVNTVTDANNVNSAVIVIESGNTDGATLIDISGRDTGAMISIPVSIVSNSTI